jgi:hypothetical protein
MIIGHITIAEYKASLDRTSMVNGYANRSLNLLVRRSRELSFGGSTALTDRADRPRHSGDRQKADFRGAPRSPRSSARGLPREACGPMRIAEPVFTRIRKAAWAAREHADTVATRNASSG